jgi:hypothetical protein
MIWNIIRIVLGIVLVFAVVTVVQSIYADYKLKRDYRKKLAFIDKAKAALRARGPLVVMNRTQDVWGITSVSDFRETLIDYGNPKQDPQVKDWDPIELRPEKTYTFARSEQERRPVHTGTWADLRRLMRQIAESILGYSLCNLTDLELDDVLKVLIEEDKRLFVPYAGRPNEGERQFKHYGYQTQVGFAREIMSKVG